MSDHTPGPWVISPISEFIFSADKGDHQQPLGFVYGPAFPERSEVGRRAMANTRLIAAAPDLLEALKDARYALYGHGVGNPKMDAAIRKAEGRS